MEESLVPNSELNNTPATGTEIAPENLEAAKTPAPIENPDDRFAAKFAALSREKKKMQAQADSIAKRAQEVEAKEKQMQERIAQLEQEAKQYQSKYERLKTPESALRALEEEGLDFEKLTKMQLNEQNPTPEMLVKRLEAQMDQKYAKKLEELEAKLAEKDQKAQNDQIEAAKAGFVSRIEAAVANNPEKYEFINYNKATDLVYNVVEEYYNTHKRVLSEEEACDMVETHLENEAKKLTSLKKLQAASAPTKPTATKGAPTLSNSLAQEIPKNGPKKLSTEESLREAAKLIRWET